MAWERKRVGGGADDDYEEGCCSCCRWPGIPIDARERIIVFVVAGHAIVSILAISSSSSSVIIDVE